MSIVGTPRRVLGQLDNNTALPSPTIKSILSPTKQKVLGLRNILNSPDANSVTFVTRTSPQAPRSPALKRKLDYIHRDSEESEKRQKSETSMSPVEENPTGSAGEAMDALDSVQSSPRSARSSQRDSIFDTTANDSQITTMTEADDNAITTLTQQATHPLSVAVHQPALTAEQARSTATTLRLRLQLSMYKIRTNQISVPLNELSIIPSHPKRNKPSSSQSSTNNAYTMSTQRPNSGFPMANEAKKRTPLPAAPSRSDSADAARPKSADAAVRSVDPETRPASPAGSPEPQSSPAKMGFATPMLPRSRDGFAGFNTMEGRSPDLTSSVVKGRAADGLLKLMSAA